MICEINYVYLFISKECNLGSSLRNDRIDKFSISVIKDNILPKIRNDA